MTIMQIVLEFLGLCFLAAVIVLLYRTWRDARKRGVQLAEDALRMGKRTEKMARDTLATAKQTEAMYDEMMAAEQRREEHDGSGTLHP